jgi:hypothetical protein
VFTPWLDGKHTVFGATNVRMSRTLRDGRNRDPILDALSRGRNADRDMDAALKKR